MCQVQSQFIISFVSFLRSKVVDEVLEILDRISTSPVESNQESSSQQFNEQMFILMKTRAHALRLSSWSGSIDKLPSKM